MSARSNTCFIDELERRTLLAATLNSGVLNVIGTLEDDEIIVWPDANDASKLNVKLNNVVSQFNRSAVTSLFVGAHRGNDLVAILRTDDPLVIKVYGDAGDDHIEVAPTAGLRAFMGDGDDRLFILSPYRGRVFAYGEDGNDQLEGGKANDLLDGGEGNDSLNGNSGNDNLVGGNGDDALSGDNGSNLLPGNDRLEGGTGNDTLRGRGGNDTLYGTDDNDVLYGDDGNDSLFGENGEDDLDGGAGNDTMTGGTENDDLFGLDADKALSDGDSFDVGPNSNTAGG